MSLLLIGLVVFLAVHLVTARRDLRARLMARLGEGPYKGLYSLISLIGLVLIVVGFGRYRAAGYIPVWTPPGWTRHVALTLMPLSFIALAAAYSPRGKIAGWLRHPMLVAVKIWALAHLIANGDHGSIILFGALLAYAVFDRIAVRKRGDVGAPRIADFNKGDAIAVVVGAVAYAAMLLLHPWLIGVRVIFV